MQLMLRETDAGCMLSVRVQPGARRSAVAGILGEGEAAALKIAVQAPALEGRANEAVIALLAKSFAVPRSSVVVLNGELSRSKVVLLKGVKREHAERMLASLLKRDSIS
jgi:uncharacterized protein (TIGR00251 family)